MQSTLFEAPFNNPAVSILSKDGSAHYYPKVFAEQDCLRWMSQLQSSLSWKPEQLMMFGKLVTTRRKVAWVGDPQCSYTYSGVQKFPQAWTSDLILIKKHLEEISQAEFNSCLLNLYYDGDDGMGWHSDDEKELDPRSPIASLSLGAKRKFAFRNKKDKETMSLFLESGSALIMHAPTQEYWQHALLKTKTASDIRMNLTFRKINTRDE
ncbi:alpha-ketoglutarate-dependent dioxygenase AlkB [Polynucleobacter sp. JS-Polo-80-F4]|uniref:alpha-ketoglutarate-dependent dioxygenase AlkB family protein n=1 Tax=Polynucleobacter sp. JS-Polo-80-F4 TaxID=2576918 RepID=UPI0021021D9C|nr:alpha-ketoglutarate-dependent dioxygenase AlkB [Polynucleobacter sp. JS-Polo-80-F4]